MLEMVNEFDEDSKKGGGGNFMLPNFPMFLRECNHRSVLQKSTLEQMYRT